MFSILQQQRQAQQNNQPKGHQLPSFLQLLQANQALNTRGLFLNIAVYWSRLGLRSDIGQVAKTQNLIKKPPKQKQPSIHQLPSSNLSSNPSSNNPIVDSVLGNLTSPVNYNACAICSMSFRLTTDLVAHMRTNHRSSRYKRKLTTEANED